MFGSLESGVNKRIVGGTYQQGHTENQQEGRDGQTWWKSKTQSKAIYTKPTLMTQSLKVKGWENMLSAKNNHKKAGVSIS